MQTIYETKVTECGDEALEFIGSGMLVIFGPEVPDILRDSVFVHDAAELTDDVRPGDTLEIGTRSWRVAKVGDVANQNLRALGHCTIAFGNSTAASDLPGSIDVEAGEDPVIEVGTVIRIVRQ